MLLYDWRSVSQYVPVSGTPLEPMARFFLFPFALLFVLVRPLWREDWFVICSIICQWSESKRTHNHTSLSHLRLIRFPFHRLLRLAGITVYVFLPASTRGTKVRKRLLTLYWYNTDRTENNVCNNCPQPLERVYRAIVKQRQRDVNALIGLRPRRKLSVKHFSLTKMYWLLGSKSKIPTSNKLLIHKTVLKPIWTQTRERLR
jgi:hypothetical protein